ncbi:TPA: hypothetical protein P0E12_004972 [Vibrio harveyi]|nr:hypothetical protein [Vibrio harveyi]
MSLLTDKNDHQPTSREPLTTKSQVEAEQRAEKAQYQRENRQKHLGKWKQEKEYIDGTYMDEDGISDLWLYLKNNKEQAHDVRVGLHSMKVNPWEYALINLAMELTGSRSSREMLVNYAKEIVKKRYNI